jgi:hypothetical protein
MNTCSTRLLMGCTMRALAPEDSLWHEPVARCSESGQ